MLNNITHLLAVFQHHDSLRVVSWTVGILALFANISVIGWMIYNNYNPLQSFKNISIRNVSNNPSLLMIFNLAVADFIGGLYLIILAISDRTFRISDSEPNENGTYNNSWIISATCFASRMLSQISLLMSIFITFLITVSRFIPVVYPYSTSEINVKKARIALVCFWIVSIAIASIGSIESLSFAFTKQHHYSILGHLCQLEAPETLLLRMTVYGELIIGVIAYAIIAILYLIIVYKLRKSSSMTISNHRRGVESKIGAIVLWIILTNIVIWIPITSITILESFTNFISDHYEIVPLLVLLLFSNTVINPVVYLIIGVYNIFKHQRQITTVVQNLSLKPTSERKKNG